jgi:hypothetical protein
MSKTSSHPPKSAEALLEERRHLEKTHPELAQSYQSFLDSYAQYREMERQFVTSPDRSRSSEPVAARLRSRR